MSTNVDWDSKTVIGFKAKAPKVARNTSDLNGMYARHEGSAFFAHAARGSFLHLFPCSRTYPILTE